MPDRKKSDTIVKKSIVENGVVRTPTTQQRPNTSPSKPKTKGK